MIQINKKTIAVVNNGDQNPHFNIVKFEWYIIFHNYIILAPWDGFVTKIVSGSHIPL